MNNLDTTPWWNHNTISLGQGDEYDMTWAATGLSVKALREKRTVFMTSTRFGQLKKGCKIEDLYAFFADSGAHEIYHSLPEFNSSGSDTRYYVWHDGAAYISHTPKDGGLGWDVYSTDREKFQKLAAKCKEFHTLARKSEGRVYVVEQTNGGLRLTSLGVAAVPFESGNYSVEVVEGFERAVTDLNSTSPSGRILILDGPPGTGKTYLVRSLLKTVQDALFVLVPSHLVSSLADPSLISALLNVKRETLDNAVPIVLIIEDADKCLVPRAADNMGSIASILNLSDGIMGALLDIRIVATTNAELKEIDEAILRPGRLSERINVSYIDAKQSCEIYKRLTGKEISPKEFSENTLAEAYRMARRDGWVPRNKGRKKVSGFLPDLDY